MITQIEIDGFKTFKDFKVELAPFQVIVGPNGSGKSNLFDALHLLSRLAERDLRTAFQEVRGEAGELFTKLPHGKSVDRMRFAIETFVNRNVQDKEEGELELITEMRALKKEVTLRFTRLRYELEIIFDTDDYGLERLYITHEALKSISPNEDNWCKKYGLSSKNNWLPEPTQDQGIFIDTKLTTIAILESVADKSTIEAKHLIISLYPDSDRQERIKRFQAREIQRTVMSREVDTEYPHVFATREELRSLKFLHLNPDALRKPSPIGAFSSLSKEGENLPKTLARMQAEDKYALTDVSRDMANLVPGILKIRIEQDKPSDKYVIYAETSDQRTFAAQVLSDGTLRLLALATLRNDPQSHGVLCLEEPENGVDPLHLRTMARVLCEMATDFNDPQQKEEPLRQVLITTHSPSFISQPEIRDSLLVAFMPSSHIQNKTAQALHVTRMMPVATPNTLHRLEAELNEDRAVGFYSIDQVRKYLDSDILDEARNQLKKARNNLIQR